MTATEYTAPEFDDDSGDDRQPDAATEQSSSEPADEAAPMHPSAGGSFAEHAVPFGTRMVGEMEQIGSEMGREDAAEGRLYTGLEHAAEGEPAAVGDAVDLGPITSVEPDFDTAAFRTIAREIFLKIRDARSQGNEQSDDGLMSPALEQQLDGEIQSDIAAHRREILAGLEVSDATIVSCEAADGRQKLGVQFVAIAQRIERDMATGAVSSEDQQAQSWRELWHFERDPSVDPNATDTQHIASFGPESWLFAHRGWVVTAIKPLDA
jgi:Tim44-like domain